MNLVTLDFETYYAKDYSLSKMSTEEYVRDERFEPLLMGFKVNDEHTKHVVGKANIAMLLDSLDIENSAVLAHHAHFDGLILAHHFGHTPKVWFDTLSMCRAIHGIEVSGSLGKLADHYGVGQKGTEITQALGKRLADFLPAELHNYARYCQNDVQLTYDLFNIMREGFPKSELRIIDMVIRMFTEPVLQLDKELLDNYVQELRANKLTLLLTAGVQLDEVMSNEKFAEALKRAGVDPPTKISMTTGKHTWAFAKTDAGLRALEDHPSDQVQALVAARLGNKSTLNETRALKLAGMAERGPATIYLRYSGAAQTHRLSGADGINWQNNERGGTIRRSMSAPPGYLLVVADSRNIESRVVDTLAGQDDAVQAYRDFDAGHGPDIYCVMAAKIYQRPITTADKEERRVGKHVKLGCGFQMGAERFRETVRILDRLEIDIDTSVVLVNIYRSTHPMVKLLWNRGQSAIPAFASGPDGEKYLDPLGMLEIEKGGILLPNGLRIRYPDLRFEDGKRWSFKSNRGERTKIYGGKVVENVVQALARNIVLEQTLRINRETGAPCKLSVHDEGVFLVREEDAFEVAAVAGEVMATPPTWWPSLPVAAEVKIARIYGDAK